MTSSRWQSQIADNLQSWDSVAGIHARGGGAAFYRVEEFLGGECRLSPWEYEELGDVTGKSLVHLQCHIGLDTLSWARRGADVTGLDFSPQAIHEAKLFAGKLGIQDAHFVVANLADAADVLEHDAFDIVYTGRGALCWLPDMNQWASVCSRLLKPGGVLYMEELHPVLSSVDVVSGDSDKILQFVYNPFQSEPFSEESSGTYADPDAETGLHINHSWEHSFADIINALISQGFRLDLLNEREESFFAPWPELMEPVSSHHWKLKPELVPIPMSYTLKANLGPVK